MTETPAQNGSHQKQDLTPELKEKTKPCLQALVDPGIQVMSSGICLYLLVLPYSLGKLLLPVPLDFYQQFQVYFHLPGWMPFSFSFRPFFYAFFSGTHRPTGETKPLFDNSDIKTPELIPISPA